VVCTGVAAGIGKLVLQQQGHPVMKPSKTAESGRELWAILRAEVGSLLGIAFFLSCCINVLYFAMPLYMMSISDRVVATHSESTFLALSFVVLVALLVQGILTGVRSRLFVRLGVRFDLRVSDRLMNSALALARTQRQELPGGGQNYVTALRSFMAGEAAFSIFDIPMVPMSMLVLYIVHPAMAAVGLMGTVALLTIAVLNETATKVPLETSQDYSGKAASFASAALANAQVIESMGMRRPILKRWHALSHDGLYYASKASDAAAKWSNLSRFIRYVMQVAMLGTGTYLSFHQEVTMGAAFAAIMLIGRGLAPVDQAIATWKQFTLARNAYTKIQQILAAAPEPEPSMPLPPPTGQLTVENVFYVPPRSDRQVLRNVSFALNAGEGLGIIGPSAAGKSTLAQLLLGVVPPTAGKVRLDGADLTRWDKNQVGRYIGYVPQDIQLFDGTIAANIARFDTSEPEAVVEAAQVAGVHEMILRLPKGYETEIGPRGAVLSQGQRQRIALARAVFGNPRLLVLDEPNSNLDNDGDRALLRALEEAKNRGTTIIMVTHRPTTLAFADKILVLRDGLVQRFDTRDAVLKEVAPVRLVPPPAAQGAARG
jgi:PrtD family type I secretion system ABC transporter